jgi:hypothetical protein
MPNQAGTYNPVTTLQQFATIGGADVTCPGATATDIFACGPVSALSPGVYQPILWVTMAFTLGAAVPTYIAIASRWNAGSVVFQTTLNMGAYAINGTYTYGLVTVGPSSDVIFRPPGGTVYLSAAIGGATGITLRNTGSYAWMQLLRQTD